MKQAYEKGADFVEFDIQLTRDLIPVVYHEFRVYVKALASNKPIKVFIKDMSLSDLQDLKLEYVSDFSKEQVPTVNFQNITEKLDKWGPGGDERPLELRTFPTLESVRHTLVA